MVAKVNDLVDSGWAADDAMKHLGWATAGTKDHMIDAKEAGADVDTVLGDIDTSAEDAKGSLDTLSRKFGSISDENSPISKYIERLGVTRDRLTDIKDRLGEIATADDPFGDIGSVSVPPGGTVIGSQTVTVYNTTNVKDNVVQNTESIATAIQSEIDKQMEKLYGYLHYGVGQP